MTDNKIIKALEHCLDSNTCEGCPYCEHGYPKCITDVNVDSLDLINRQKAEIERLEGLVYSADNETANVRDLYFEEKSERAEAIKEFAERLKARVVDDFMNYKTDATIGYIDNLVKEMVGEDNAE